MSDEAEEPHLVSLPDRLRRHDPPVSEDVLALVEAEHGRWRQLHDRLVALIAALIDVASSDGRPVREVIEQLVADTSVPLDSLVRTGIDPAEIAGLLRSHGSKGVVTADGDTTVFRHECGSGGRYWRDNPNVPTVAEGEVPGVPPGRPRYCARCMYTIAGHGGDQWTVSPPADPSQPCVWTVTSRPADRAD